MSLDNTFNGKHIINVISILMNLFSCHNVNAVCNITCTIYNTCKLFTRHSSLGWIFIELYQKNLLRTLNNRGLKINE
jgi:hypothetical protein